MIPSVKVRPAQLATHHDVGPDFRGHVGNHIESMQWYLVGSYRGTILPLESTYDAPSVETWLRAATALQRMAILLGTGTLPVLNDYVNEAERRLRVSVLTSTP